MDKGISQYAFKLFAEQNELRRQGTEYTGAKGNTVFRKHIMATLMEQFGISLASSSTHYNGAFKALKKLDADLVSSLGRPEDKKGGRKAKTALTAKELTQAAQQDTAEPVQTIFTVKKKSDGTVIAEGLSFEAAKTLVEKAAKAKKSKLYWV